MANQNKKDNLQEIVIKLTEQKSDLRIPGMQDIHPMYEALIALLRKQLKDDELVTAINDEESLRRVLAADVFLENLPSNKRDKLITSLKSGKSLKEIVDEAALALSEDKRTQDGNILYRADQQSPDKYFMKALTRANPYNIYLEKVELDLIKRKTANIKKIDKIKKIIIAASVGVLISCGIYLFKNRYVIGGYLQSYYTSEESEKTINR